MNKPKTDRPKSFKRSDKTVKFSDCISKVTITKSWANINPAQKLIIQFVMDHAR